MGSLVHPTPPFVTASYPSTGSGEHCKHPGDPSRTQELPHHRSVSQGHSSPSEHIQLGGLTHATVKTLQASPLNAKKCHLSHVSVLPATPFWTEVAEGADWLHNLGLGEAIYWGKC